MILVRMTPHHKESSSFFDWELQFRKGEKRNKVCVELPFIEIISAQKMKKKDSNTLRPHNMIRFNSQTFRLNDHNYKRLMDMCEEIMKYMLYIRPTTFQDDRKKMGDNVYKNRKRTKAYFNHILGRD